MNDAPAKEMSTPAGIYDCLLGGAAHSEADRIAAAQLRERMPEVVDAAWANRGFLQRVVTYLARSGVRQFLDIGAGLPTQRNTHEVAADIAPDCRVVYVDIDPSVIERGRRMLADTATAVVIQGDLRSPDAILAHPETQRLLDFSQPIGLLLLSVMQFVPDEADPHGLVARYLSALAPGSYLALSVGTSDRQAERIVEGVRSVYDTATEHPQPRTLTDAERFFAGLEIVPPYQGASPELTYIGLWGAEDPQAADDDGSRWFYVAVARKP